MQELELFKKSKSHEYGRANLCSECVNRYMRENYHKNKEAIHKRRAEYRLENIEHVRERERRYREAHPEQVKESAARYREKNKKIIALKAQNYILFKDKRIPFKENPRTNVCSECGLSYPKNLERQTHLHHDKYDPINPLAHTRELCVSCHMKEHNTGMNNWKGEDATEHSNIKGNGEKNVNHLD